MMRIAPISLGWLLAVSIVAAAGCAGDARTGPSPAPETTFVLVRHAEKAKDDPKDPNLSDAGRARAQRLAQRLDGQRVTAVYATGYRRTQSTAAPTAAAHGLDVRTYDASMPAADFAARLRREHTADVVLIVGHSNTVAPITAALCACAVAPMDEDEYDRLMTVRIGADGQRSVDQVRY